MLPKGVQAGSKKRLATVEEMREDEKGRTWTRSTGRGRGRLAYASSRDPDGAISSAPAAPPRQVLSRAEMTLSELDPHAGHLVTHSDPRTCLLAFSFSPPRRA